MIQFDQVAKRYASGLEALQGLSFRVDSGEFVFVTGHSGAGKSTLLKLIGLLERPSHGQVQVGGWNTSQVRGDALAHFRRRIGMVFQDHRLLLDRSVFANLAMPLQIAGLRPDEIGKRVRAALDRVGLLGREKALPMALSSGEQQRVGIARAVAMRPPVLIADEPTGNLDPKLAQEIMELFVSLQQSGSCVIVASHDLPLIKRWRKRVLVLDHGRLLDDFRPEPGAPT